MTLIEILFFLAGVAIAAAVGFPLAAWSRIVLDGVVSAPVGTILCAVIGLVGGCGATIIVYSAVWGLVLAYYAVFPLRPQCRRGKCKSEDYRWDAEDLQRFRMNPSTSPDTVFVCKCGDKYLCHGRCFDELLSDGVRRPYMVHPPFWRRWRSAV